MRPSPILIYIQSRSDIFSQDESDCPDEEECEIDWGAMPGFGDDDEDDTKKESSTKEQEATATGEGRHLIVDETDELEPQEVYVRKVERSVDTSRKILEMNWQIENCDVACSGTGAISPWAKTHDGTLWERVVIIFYTVDAMQRSWTTIWFFPYYY